MGEKKCMLFTISLVHLPKENAISKKKEGVICYDLIQLQFSNDLSVKLELDLFEEIN